LNIIIYGSSFDIACRKTKELLDKIPTEELLSVIKSKDKFEIRLKNGDRYRTLSSYNISQVRGVRWQYAYIDNLINDEILHNYIYCKFIPKQPAEGRFLEEYDNIMDCREFY